MTPRARFIAAVGAGFLAGAAAVLVLAGRPMIDLPPVPSLTSAGDDGQVVESFFFEAPGDAVALTHSGKVPFAAA